MSQASPPRWRWRQRSATATGDNRARKRNVSLAVMFGLLIVASVGSLFLGATTLTLSGILRGDEEELLVLWESRLPRLLAVLLAGSALSIAGLVMMNLTRNRFVTPS